jgi:hypothetical protein
MIKILKDNNIVFGIGFRGFITIVVSAEEVRRCGLLKVRDTTTYIHTYIHIYVPASPPPRVEGGPRW